MVRSALLGLCLFQFLDPQHLLKPMTPTTWIGFNMHRNMCRLKNKHRLSQALVKLEIKENTSPSDMAFVLISTRMEKDNCMKAKVTKLKE